MTTRFRRPVGLCAVMLAPSILSGCVHSREDASTAHPAHSFRVDSGLKLVVVMGRDTIRPDEQASIEVNFYVVNGPQLTTFDNDPGFYTVRVETSDGRPVNLVDPNGPASGSLGETRISLPARATLGQVINLRCLADGGGYAARDPAGSSRICLGSYPFRESGKYQVIVDYLGPEFRWQRLPMPRGGNAAVDTGGTLTTLAGARHMADTAILVVR